MTAPADPSPTRTAREPTADELVADIQRTRAQLSESVDSLVARLDVKAQARARADATKRRLRQQAASVQALGHRVAGTAKDAAPDHDPARTAFPVVAVSALTLAVVAVLIWRRRR